MNNEFSNQVSNITIYSKFLGTALFKKQYAYIIKLCAALAIIVGIWKLFCNVLSLNAPDLLLQIIMLISIITATFVIFFQIFNKQDLVLNLGQNEHIEIRENEICLVNNETNEVLINSFFRNYDIHMIVEDDDVISFAFVGRAAPNYGNQLHTYILENLPLQMYAEHIWFYKTNLISVTFNRATNERQIEEFRKLYESQQRNRREEDAICG